MAAETQYTANTGTVNISTANPNLDGTGTLGVLISAATGNGTVIKTITIKATTTVTQGAIRFFIFDGTNYRLIKEVEVDPYTQSATSPTFEYVWLCDINLKTSDRIYVGTEKAESFNIFAEGLDWAYYATAVRPESTNFTANTGMTVISTANSNLDGTGTLGTILTAGSSATYKGCRVEQISIQAIGNVTTGMVRIFLYDGTNTRLLHEELIPAWPRSATAPAFSKKININFQMQANYVLKAAPQNAESFAIIVQGNDWKYPA